jgi:hypothetical protein
MEFEISVPMLQSLADLAGITVPDEDLEPLRAVLANQWAMASHLRPLDVSDLPPIVSLDPRWT